MSHWPEFPCSISKNSTFFIQSDCAIIAGQTGWEIFHDRFRKAPFMLPLSVIVINYFERSVTILLKNAITYLQPCVFIIFFLYFLCYCEVSWIACYNKIVLNSTASTVTVMFFKSGVFIPLLLLIACCFIHLKRLYYIKSNYHNHSLSATNSGVSCCKNRMLRTMFRLFELTWPIFAYGKYRNCKHTCYLWANPCSFWNSASISFLVLCNEIKPFFLSLHFKRHVYP